MKEGFLLKNLAKAELTAIFRNTKNKENCINKMRERCNIDSNPILSCRFISFYVIFIVSNVYKFIYIVNYRV